MIAEPTTHTESKLEPSESIVFEQKKSFNNHFKIQTHKKSKSIDPKYSESFQNNHYFRKLYLSKKNLSVDKTATDNGFYNTSINFQTNADKQRKGTSKMWKINSVNGFRKDESVFIHEEDSNKIFNETDIKRFTINNDIDKWEYKNLTEKDMKTGKYVQNNSNEKTSEYLMDQNSGISIGVLNSSNNLSRAQVKKCNVTRGERKLWNTSEEDHNRICFLDMIADQTRTRGKINMSEQYKQKSMNKQIINDIYYKKSWDAYINSMTREQLLTAKEKSVHLLHREGSIQQKPVEKKNKTIELNKKKNSIDKEKSNEIHGSDDEIIDENILSVKKRYIKNNLMTSFKNLNNFFTMKNMPLDDTKVKHRMIVSLTNYNDKDPNEVSYVRDLDNIICNLMSEITTQDLIVERLKKKTTKLTSQLRLLTKQSLAIEEYLSSLEKEKRFKVATATYLFQGYNSNPKKSVFKNTGSMYERSRMNTNALNRSYEAEYKIQNALDVWKDKQNFAHNT